MLNMFSEAIWFSHQGWDMSNIFVYTLAQMMFAFWQGYKMQIYIYIFMLFFPLSTLLLLSQLAMNWCFTFFSGMQQRMHRELLLLVWFLVDTTVHQSCAQCNLCLGAWGLACSMLAGDAGKGLGVAPCPHWPMHKEIMTLQVLRAGTFLFGYKEETWGCHFSTGHTDLHHKAGKKTCISSALTVGLLNYTYKPY